MDLLGRANTVGQTPYTPYDGELVPGVNAQQNLGIGNINANSSYAQPYIQQAAGLATQASTPLTAAQIQQYQNPFTTDVINSTQDLFNTQNAQQLQGVKGNAIAQNALGGNREGVAEAETVRNQQLAQAPVLAGLRSQGYQQGVGTALAEQQAQAQGAYSLGNLGVSGQNAALTGANAQVGAGNLQYGVASAADQAAYQQFLNQQAFPYQQLQWNAGIASGLGSQLGGTSTTTSPGPNVLGQVAGAGLTAASLFANRGGRIEPRGIAHFDVGGGVSYPQFGGGYGAGSTPYGGGHGWVPSIGITHGHGAPPPPGIGNQGGGSQGTGGLGGGGGYSNLSNLGGDIQNMYNGYNANGTASGNQWVQAGQELGPYAAIDSSSNFADPGIGFVGGGVASGGRIHGYADGGSPDDIDASDLVVNGGRGGLALGVTPNWDEHQQATLAGLTDRSNNSAVDDPDSPYNRDLVRGIALGDNGLNAIASATHTAPTARGVALPPDAMSFTANGTDQSPDYVRDRNAAPPPQTNDLTYQHPNTGIRGALMAAGLGMMASRSPFLGTMIGEGGLGGLREYNAEQAQNISEAEKKTGYAQQNKRIDLESTRLDQAAKQAQQKLNLETQAQKSGTWYQQQEAAKPVPMGQHIDPTTLMPMQTYGVRQPDGSLKPVEVPPAAAPDPNDPNSGSMSGLIDPAAIHDMAVSYVKSGNTAVMQNLGFGKTAGVNRARLWNEIERTLKDSGATGEDLAAARVNFTAQTAGARTAAVRGANVDMSVREAQNTFPLALDASAALPRTEFVPWNKAVQMVQAGTSSPALARFVTANQAVITAYAQAMSRANVTTDHSRISAERLLSTATSPEAYQAVLDQMGKEMHAAQLAPDAVRRDIESRITGRPASGAATTPATTGAPAPKIGEKKQFKQGIGVWNGTTWVPKGQP